MNWRESGVRITASGLMILGLCTSPVFAGNPPSTVDFYLNNVTGSAQLAGVYTSPYYGGLTSTANLPIICDDFSDNSYVPEEWTAYVTSLSQIPTSGDDTILKWGSAQSGNFSNPGVLSSYNTWDIGNQQEAYSIAAILQLDILNSVNNNGIASQATEDYSFALWELFDAQGNSVENWGPAVNDQVVNWLSSRGDSGDLQNATQDVEDAIAQYNSKSNPLSGYNVTIYSYDAATPPACGSDFKSGCSTKPPQEFMTITKSVPEPNAASLYEMAAYLVFGGVAFVVSRWRTSNSIG